MNDVRREQRSFTCQELWCIKSSRLLDNLLEFFWTSQARRTVCINHYPASFSDDKYTSGHVPRHQIVSVIGFRCTHCHITKSQCRWSHCSYPVSNRDGCLHSPENSVSDSLDRSVRCFQAQQRVLQFWKKEFVPWKNVTIALLKMKCIFRDHLSECLRYSENCTTSGNALGR